jgi:hypothetical protein
VISEGELYSLPRRRNREKQWKLEDPMQPLAGFVKCLYPFDAKHSPLLFKAGEFLLYIDYADKML